MTIHTVYLDTAQLAPIFLRRPFEPGLTRDKTPAMTGNGEAIFYAEGMVPGLVNGRFSFEPAIGSVRIRVLGDRPTVNGVVRLDGKVTMTATYARGQRMSDRNSHITITAERVRPADGELPGGRGFLPGILPVAGTILSAQPQDANAADNPRWVVDVALDPDSSYVVDGLAEIICMGAVPAELLGRPVRPVDLKVRYTSPDTLDVSQRSRAELLLSCSGFEALGQSPAPTGRGRRAEEAAPEPVDAA